MKKRIQPHLMLGEGDVEQISFLSGDPDRVPLIASYLKDAEEVAKHRGLVSFKGYTPGGVCVTVTTTGMGPSSTAIVLEELRRLGGEAFIRIGSCGGLPLEVKTGDLVIPFAAVRDEATSLTYVSHIYPAVASPEVYSALTKACRHKAVRFHTGLVWTTAVYYQFTDPDAFKYWLNRRVIAVEMESSLLFTFAQVYGLAAGSILACDGNLQVDPKGELETAETEAGELHSDLKKAIVQEIKVAIDAVDCLKLDYD